MAERIEQVQKETPLAQWVQNFDAGQYDSANVNTQIGAGWYDWFCKDESLVRKLRLLAPKVKKIAKSPKIDPTKTYVWFKNNCPMVGNLYDDFRIADITTNETIYTIVPSSGHTRIKGRAEVWGAANNWSSPLVKGTWKDVTNYFGV